MSIQISTMTAEDWEPVRAIYLAGIATGQATFETEVPTWPTWNNSHLPAPRLVATSKGIPGGWAALSPVSGSRASAGVAEVSVYVAEQMRGTGVGGFLLKALVKDSEENGIW